MTYGPDGEVLWVTATESRFTRDDVAHLLASRRAERMPRGPHGHLLSESTDPALKGRWKVRKPRRDYLQTQINAEQKRYRKIYPDSDHSALLWGADLD